MRLAVLLGLAALPLFAAAESNSGAGHEPAYAPLKPFSATYDVQRGGKTIGEATMTLKSDGGDNWTLVTQTRGTAGMARLLGLDVREESRFAANGQQPLQSTAYSYQQEATLKSRQRRIEFDWSAREARVTDKDELFRYALQPYSIDRHAIVVALGRAQGLEQNTLHIASKDAVEDQRYERRETQPLELPAGRFDATRYERTDKPGKGSSWYTPNLLAPLQVEQAQKDGANIVMRLRRIE
ncbi:DUF3108 domain-containing protein [Tahibacter caeni]|uniref:DUF3108 domain-containing protein n=1 Tax=Tahibacter caeni TaxID=1453545 RepID=UPI0021472634|nr:DUF3108 domain-containing protein [Tahibacter caeni]